MNPSPQVDSSALEPQVLGLRVVNFNEFEIADRFDGTLFKFPPHVPVDVPVDAALHIFGWFPTYTDQTGEQHHVDPAMMRTHCQRRFGWNTPDMVKNGSTELFYSQLKFKPIVYRMVPVPVDEDDDVAETPPPKRKPNKLMDAADAAEARHAQ